MMRRGSMFLAVAIAAAVVLSGVGFFAFAGGEREVDADEPVTMRINSSHSVGSAPYIFLNEYKERVEEQLGDAVDIQIFMDNLLGSEEDVTAGLGTGLFDASLAASYVMEINPAANVFELPYLFADRSEVLRFIDSPAYEMIYEAFQAENIRMIAIWENGFRVITNNVRPIVTPDDLRGVSIRTPDSRPRMAMFEAMGANPGPLAFGEVYSALDTGVFDGQENPPDTTRDMGFHEVQRYMSLSNHVYIPTFFLIGEPFLRRLPEDVRDVLISTAQEMTEWTFEWGEEEDERVFVDVRDQMEINEVDVEAFRAAVMHLYEAPLFVNRIGEEMIRVTLEALGR